MLRLTACVSGLALLLYCSGCQLIGEPRLPSTYQLTDDVQYFAPGPDFKLSREAATQTAQHSEAKPEAADAETAETANAKPYRTGTYWGQEVVCFEVGPNHKSTALANALDAQLTGNRPPENDQD